MRPDRSTFTPVDFTTWREANSLVIQPKFQRRGVWTVPARSFLIDTMLRGYPVPPIYLRVAQSADRRRVVREVVDGQQRISAVLDYLADGYALSPTLDAEYRGKRFSDLAADQQDSIRTYGFICETFHGISDALVLEIFARLNTYSVKLNAQELRNGKFFGAFKQAAYRLAHEHLEFWRVNSIFSDNRIARMTEVELTSELMICLLAGIQDKKAYIDTYYADYDSDFPNRARIESRFRAVIDTITDSLGPVLANAEFHRPPLFYTLFSVVAHRLYGLPGISEPTSKRRFVEKDRMALADAVLFLSDKLAAAKQEKPVGKTYQPFVSASTSQTDNLGPRKVRFEALYRQAFIW